MICVVATSAAAAAIEVTVPPAVIAAPLPADAKSRPVSLTRLAANISPGTPWRQDTQSPYFMVPCAVTTELRRWTEDDNKIGSIDVFDRIFRDEIRTAGFRAGNDPTNLFEEQTGSDLQVGALITELRMKTCDYIMFGAKNYSGAAVMDVQWQIYSVSQAKVLARIGTHGGFELKPTRQSGDADASPILRGAFADNVNRLTASTEFRQIMAASTPSAAVTPVAALSFVPARGTASMAAAVKSVVAIYAGDGMGSGVLISPDGYILTNHHVAGSGGQVRVHWADGTDTIGDVLRGDPRRDVALIRTTPKAGPLALRHTPVQLGETVFAIGTPLRKEFANTLTRGVISGVRLIDGQPVIQSDVAIDRGNSGGPLLDEQGRVVALTVSRYEEEGVGRNINFFIPIDEVLKALSVAAQADPSPPVTPRR